MNATSGFTALNHLPPESRPRERLFAEGAHSLSPAELIALLIGSGSKNRSAVTIGEQLLGCFEGLAQFAAASTSELCAVSGIGEAKAAKIIAAVELGKRLAASKGRQRLSLSHPEAAAEVFIAEMRHLPVEHLRVAVLDTKNRLLRLSDAAIGSLNVSAVRPADVFRHVLTANGAACIIAHNHPSGDPRPSSEDLSMTERLKAGAGTLGIDLLDHIIVGDGSFYSLRQEGLF